MSPSYRYDYAHVSSVLNALGTAAGISVSGEERQLDFTGAGTVLIQSSEESMMDAGTPLANIMSQVPGLQKNELQSLAGTIAQRLKGA
jgi:uncharacterized protein (AIM24 family)